MSRKKNDTIYRALGIPDERLGAIAKAVHRAAKNSSTFSEMLKELYQELDDYELLFATFNLGRAVEGFENIKSGDGDMAEKLLSKLEKIVERL